MNVELVYESTCPNVAAARTALLRAFADAGRTPDWQEWEVGSADAPAHVHGYGSPTILVDGRDVTGEAPDRDDLCCRVYTAGDSACAGVPPHAQIVAALSRGAQPAPAAPPTPGRVARTVALLPGIGVALLPKLTCPACWPAYAGLLSSLGLGFFDYTPYMLPALLGFVALALAALAYRARLRRGYGPFALGLVAGALLIAAKFHFDSDALMWSALALLVGASLWNTWPLRARDGCPACVDATAPG